MSRVAKLSKYITAKPHRIFWAFATLHLVMWTLVPSLLCPNLPLDPIEGYAWGKEWLMGTHKHPPLQNWILESLYMITGRGRWAPYLASQIAIVTAFWAVWQTGRRIAGETVGLIGALLLEGVIYYNYTSPEFNPNVLQLPFWALIGWSFHKAVKDDKLADWLLLGLWTAAGMYTKYSTGLFLLTIAISLFAHRDGRARLKRPGPYIAVLTAIIFFIPHFSWLIDNHFIPLQYAEGRLEETPGHYSSGLGTLLMVAGQVLALLFAMFLIVVLYDRRRAPSRNPVASFDRLFLTFAAFGPFISMFCVSLIVGYHVRDMWETPFWNFTGLWAIVLLRPALMPIDLRRFALTWALVFSIGIIFFVTTEVLGPYESLKPKRTIFPGKKLSQIIIDSWHEKYHTPLNYVIGDTWPAGNVAWYADDRPHVFMDGDPRISPWINQADLKADGGVIVWCIHCGQHRVPQGEPEKMKIAFPSAEVQEPLTIKRMTFADVSPVVIGWAILPPNP